MAAPRLAEPSGDRIVDDVAIAAFRPGERVPADAARQLAALFDASYLRYPYAHEVGATERFELVALDGDQVLGYASFLVAGRYASCAHLLVAAAARGRGLGRRLDHARHQAAGELGLDVYVSCLCQDVASQRLKLELGMVPVNLKLGHQVESFVSATGVGTALVFSEGELSPQSPVDSATIVDAPMRRARVMLPDGSKLVLQDTYDGWYCDVLTGPHGARDLARHPELAYAGLELDRAAGTWHYCFQLVNDIYRRGLTEPLALVADAEAIAELHPLPTA